MYAESSYNRNLASAAHAYSTPFWCIGGVVLMMFLCSCSSTRHLQPDTALVVDGVLPPPYSIIYVIHGDSGYLYHDSDGNAYRADEEVLVAARKVAAENTQAEVFIFHERRRRRFLRLFFTRRDGTFYYYRNGQLLAEKSYWRDHGQARFDPELDLFNRFRLEEAPEQVRLFLYFGHEIPEFDGAGYDASYKNRAFTTDDLADALRRFSPDSTKFDLIVLSTCFNGTPFTIGTLAPYARFIIASPENLHLSHFDQYPLERLDMSLGDGDVSAFAKKFARHTFEHLTEDIQTVITVAVYDVERVQGFLRSVDNLYGRALTRLKEQKQASIERYDCADDPAYVTQGMMEGVDILFRASRFGRTKHKKNHSGWECWKLPEYSLSKQ